MTGPTSEGSVNKKFLNDKYVEEGKIAGGGFNADTELTMEETGNPNLEPGMEIPTSNSKVELSKEDKNKIDTYVVKVLNQQIRNMEKMLETEENDNIKIWMKRKIEVMKIQLNMAKDRLTKNADKDDISK